MRNSPLRTITLTSTEAAVLGLLAAAPREVSGYNVMRASDRSVGYFWSPARSQIYTVLPRLVEAGLARRRDVAQSGKPDKQLYRVTAAGRRALREWLAEPVAEPDASRNTLLVKLFFGDHGEIEPLLEHVRKQRRAAEDLLTALDELEAHDPGGPHDFFPSLTRAYGREWARGVIRWAKRAERALEARP